MGKYILNRILRSILSLIAVMIFTIVLIYSLMDREALVTKQPSFNKNINNDAITFKYETWENYGYVETYDYRNFCSVKYGNDKDKFDQCINIDEVFTSQENYCKVTTKDKIDPNAYAICMSSERNYKVDAEIPEIAEFIKLYKKNGYEIVRKDPVLLDSYEETDYLQLAQGGSGILFAYKSKSTFTRLWEFFKGVFYFDGKNYYQSLNKKNASLGQNTIEMDSYLRFEKDFNGNVALRCNGCKNKYLLYFDNKFPFIHQNWIEINLGRSMQYGKDTVEVMTDSQMDPIIADVTYPNGEVVENTHKINFHSCQINMNPTDMELSRYDGYYTNCAEVRSGKSMMSFSFMIGIIATVVAYLFGVPIGILMAKNKGKLIDKLGICYIIFMMAVPSLAYIYIFRRIGFNAGLPVQLQLVGNAPAWTAYILPIVSLALPSIGGLMSWIRRYMIDQMNSDYVKFARAKGLSELEIFNKHIFKNAVIPIVHNIPGGLLGSLTGALITERVFGIPGVGKLFTDAIEKTDNGMLVGLTFFYAILSITALILGDVMMAIVDPRISFSEKGGRR